MTTTRILPGVLLALAATAGPAAAQYGYEADGPPTIYPGVPVVQPPGHGGMPPGRPPAAGANAVDRLTAPIRPAGGEVADPYATLTGQPVPQATAPGLPPGSYPSPYYTDGPGCCGPLGRNGRVGYELYYVVGINQPFGEGAFARQLNPGITVGGGGRSLFFNPTHDAAWVVDLGLTYTFNDGELNHPRSLYVRQGPQTDIFGNTTPRPDVLAPTAIRGLTRTNFNFGIGRDWWRWGPGAVGVENGWNVRFGGLVGGRWGTAHVDLVPQVPALGDYQRRQGVTHGVFLAAHAGVEVPMGAWIAFLGGRVEWGYDWTNLVPPQQGNLHNINLMLTGGFRF